MLTLLLGCWVYKKVPDIEVISGGQNVKKVEGVVGLAPTVFLADLNDDEDDFRAGAFVGNVVMSGGYLLENTGDAGLQTVSKDYELNSVEAYRSTITDWTDVTLSGLLDDRGVTWKRIEVDVPAPIWRAARGSHLSDGTDNVNLPRFTLEPNPIDPVSGVDVVLVPMVVQYYSHNAGWFVGQEHGCGAGARFRMLWTAYDAASGAPLEWRDIDQRSIEPYVFQANSAQLEDLLIEVEEGLAKDMKKELFR